MPNLLIGARGAGDFSPDNWSRYNSGDIVTKTSIAFVASTDLDVHSATEIQASISTKQK